MIVNTGRCFLFCASRVLSPMLRPLCHRRNSNIMHDPKVIAFHLTQRQQSHDEKEHVVMKGQVSQKEQTRGSAVNPNEPPDLGALFDGHIQREFADLDVDATMETMVAEPYVHCIATLAGGFGGQEVRRFYGEHFINQIPKDAKVTPISRTIGKDQVVDEFILSFTHDTQWDYLLPGIPPTGKRVELPHVLVMKF